MTQKLTKAEEEIMLILWKKEEATIREVIQELAVANIPYTTVSTVVCVLEKKKLVGHKAVGTTYLYYPILKKDEYLKGSLQKIVSRYFDGSFSSLASFFARQNDLDLAELKTLMHEIESKLTEPGDPE